MRDSPVCRLSFIVVFYLVPLAWPVRLLSSIVSTYFFFSLLPEGGWAGLGLTAVVLWWDLRDPLCSWASSAAVFLPSSLLGGGGVTHTNGCAQNDVRLTSLVPSMVSEPLSGIVASSGASASRWIHDFCTDHAVRSASSPSIALTCCTPPSRRARFVVFLVVSSFYYSRVIPRRGAPALGSCV